jgi:integrase
VRHGTHTGSGWTRAGVQGQREFEDAVVAAEDIVRNDGRRSNSRDAILSDGEFEEIQRAHFAKKTDAAARDRANKTLEECIDAIGAFRQVSGLSSIALATPDDCERFQKSALQLPKNWRQKYPNSREVVECLSPNTVLKWSRSLQAAFERVNKAAGRKCVRGVVEESKLLTANPWSQFSWIEGSRRPIRQFDGDELLSLLTFLETRWVGVPLGAAAAKVFLWSSCRKLEVSSLTWNDLRTTGDEYHFQVIGKWGVERWFRIPPPLYRELLTSRTDSPYVFGAYNQQLRQLHANNPGCLRKITTDFRPANFGRWFYERLLEWSKSSAKGPAFVHIFRKTTLQHARRGEDINRQVASDARISESVLVTNYVKEMDEELRQKSNRTFQRILASLPTEVARRYGNAECTKTDLEHRLTAATDAKDWDLVAALSARLAQSRRSGVG